MSVVSETPLLNDRFLRACKREKTDRTPMWLMRQAGRYLPEYNETRSRAGSFLALAKNPTLATEVTLQPLDRYDLDAAILFSDILTIPDAMGLGLSFEAGEGPRFSNPLQSEEQILKLKVADMNQLKYVFDAVSEIRRALIQNGKQRVPLIGFSGSPWTLACYMVEGRGSSDFQKTKSLLYKRPDLMKRILDMNVQSVTEYLQLQIDAGAQAVMLFDTWGGMLPWSVYQEFSLAPMKAIIQQIKAKNKDIPVLLFTKGGGVWLEEMGNSGADVLALDWTMSLAKARQTLLANGQKITLQGNLDPMILLSEPAAITSAVEKLFEELALTSPIEQGLSPLDGHIFNLGHGISQFTPPENVAALVDAVIKNSTELRQSA
jgi:uroporphyrinogen decarboxylase